MTLTMSCHAAMGASSHCGNETRDLLAGLFAEVCSDVCVEPRLQPLSGESLSASAKKDDEARLDIRVRGFWGIRQQDAFFDVRVLAIPLRRLTAIPAFRLFTDNKIPPTHGRGRFGFRSSSKKPSLSPFSVALESSFLVFGFHRRLPPSTFGGIHAG